MSNVKFIPNAKGDFVTQEIFTATVAIDGRFKDETQDDRNKLVKTIYNNTTKYIISPGISIPIKDGHDDTSQETKGYVQSLTLKKRTVEGLGLCYSIWARIFLFEPYYSLYVGSKDSEPRYLGMSVEVSPEGFSADGKEFTDHLTAVALCGIDMTAFPLMSRELESHAISNYYSVVGPRNYTLMSKKEKYMAMSPEDQLAKVQDILSKAFSDISDVITAEESDETTDEAPADETKTEAAAAKGDDVKSEDDSDKKDSSDKDKEMKREFAKLTADKIELAYEKLAFAGKIGKDQKANFTKIAQNTGLDTALSVFSVVESKRPPVGKEFTADRSAKTLSKERLEAIQRFARNNKELEAKLIQEALLKEGK